MARAFLFVLDSFGVGGAPDAARFDDAGADTLGHIAKSAAIGGADQEGLRRGPLKLPVMAALGLGRAARIAGGADPFEGAALLSGSFHGAAEEVSIGKDTITGHWEIAGIPVPFAWGYFPETVPAFPPELTEAIIREGAVPGILGNCHASGTGVIEEFGEEHIRTGKPICYTSVDSVLQIAAHETHFGLERLYELCRTVRRLVDPLNIGRVIARPFVGEAAGSFERTGNRRDYAVPPPEATLLDRVVEHGGRVIAMGKIGDIFAHRGISEVRKASGNLPLFDKTLVAMDDAKDGDLVFANFVDFDTNFGHRRDVPGYAEALEAFDRRLPEALARLRPGDLLILTADHGCDPTWRGTDHTRERVPIFGVALGRRGGSAGLRATYADIAETIAAHLGLPKGPHGTPFSEVIEENA
ncbi:phosphopentomutase [Pseudaminobacter sp. 19-2017]|uniref:Phosphopentomutase n=1 Tax=Pseudaminobacter soli (ex Zhang et al. 2022) TaxID=2831468 RepID=A0A942E0Z9_9HYPH|nr:phosphopentomutase [Pseudaminobacter soli]MBS3651103.1 phosphopentomutase [Pseudaminobacter soli]